MTQQSKPGTDTEQGRARTGGYGYGGSGLNGPNESTFGEELGEVVERNPSSSPREGTHPVASAHEPVTYTTDPIQDAADRSQIPSSSSVERGEHYEKATGFALARGVGSLFIYGSALLAVTGLILAALLQFMLAIPVLVVAVGLFYLGKRVTQRSHERAEQHFAPLRKK